MTFDSNMQAVQQDAIPELFDITAGGYVWRYTSYKTDITFLTNLYKAATIKRSGFTMDARPGSAKVTVSVPLSEPIQSYISASPLPSTNIKIYRAVASSLSDYALLFDGMVKQVSGANKILSAECSPAGKLTARLPHIVYQSFCNWQVFDCYCGLDATAYAVPATVTVSGSTLVSGTFAAYADDYFTQGRILYDGDFRFVTSHVGNTITLHVPFSASLITGSAVTAYPGCDGKPATCKTKYNNFATRHVSMPYIPSHNPVIWSFK